MRKGMNTVIATAALTAAALIGTGCPDKTEKTEAPQAPEAPLIDKTRTDVVNTSKKPREKRKSTMKCKNGKICFLTSKGEFCTTPFVPCKEK